MSYILSHNDGAPAQGIVGGLWEYARGGPRGRGLRLNGEGMGLLMAVDFQNNSRPQTTHQLRVGGV